MKKIFIACPYVKYCSDGVFQDDNYKEFLESLYSLCMRYAEHVFLALKAEDYGNKPRQNYSCLMDMNELSSSDLVIALPDDSMGVAVELGWASALQKRVILIIDINKTYSPLIAHINSITTGTIISYDTNMNNALSDLETTLEFLKQ